MKPHHEAWLTAHPERTADWLREKIREGFDVHHMDGNRDNNEPGNLVLIDHIDHMRLHGMHQSDRLHRLSMHKISAARRPRRKSGPEPYRKRTAILPDGRQIIVFRGEREADAVDRFLRHPDHNAFRLINQLRD